MFRESEVRAPSHARWLRVEVVSDVLSFARLRTEWTVLHESSGASLFTAWEWLQPWVHRIGPDRTLRVLCARDRSGRLVGLLPLALQERRVLGRKVRRLTFLGDAHVGSDFLDVVADSGTREEVTRAFVAYLRDTQADWDVLDLLDVDAESPSESLLRESFGIRDYRLQVRPRFVCPWEAFLPAETFHSFLRRTGRRDNYLRRRRWLDQQEGFRIDRVVAPGKLAGPLASFFRLHAARWAEEGGSDGIRGPEVEAFHRDATQLLAERGKVWLYTLSLAGRPLASVYGLVHGGTFLYYQSGYDPAWRHRSVGLVLLGQTFKDALDAGCTAYDFLRGTEAYKSEWATRQRRTVALRVHPRGGVGQLLGLSEEAGRRLRSAARRVLPAPWTESLRRLRRRRSALRGGPTARR
ncbi:MAG: GNAT family N-acetyltransferase [Myxococcaceae bacterium]|nr:GNAT family N-acetyltransferase [Myxococcaceae bacterium]MCI0670034.1 GNAT family N-acetyltransferase [Myxococcaceae bacterium]